ncbi:hypothetical protein O3P69_003482 [Scylla paramamosain]|uniref:Uncharacterized protein n=1 Tax=Scylla paramamosain TaxID=85552 RepID=A0AAW0UL95_SCYPA
MLQGPQTTTRVAPAGTGVMLRWEKGQTPLSLSPTPPPLCPPQLMVLNPLKAHLLDPISPIPAWPALATPSQRTHLTSLPLAALPDLAEHRALRIVLEGACDGEGEGEGTQEKKKGTTEGAEEGHGEGREGRSGASSPRRLRVNGGGGWGDGVDGRKGCGNRKEEVKKGRKSKSEKEI